MFYIEHVTFPKSLDNPDEDYVRITTKYSKWVIGRQEGYASEEDAQTEMEKFFPYLRPDEEADMDGIICFRIGQYCPYLSYAIIFDLDTETLKQAYPNSLYNNAYGDIRKTLESLGFVWQQGNVYFGSEKINAVTCVIAAQALSREYSWFKASVRDIRMLRIEEMNNLKPAL